MAKRGRPPYPDVLTPREWEVLGLLRDGLTNGEIAERLDISLAGAKYHVSEILSKLAVSSREEAAHWRPAAVPWWVVWPALNRLFRRGGGLNHVAPAILAGTLLVVVAGIGVLVWGLLRTNGGDDRPASVGLATGRSCEQPAATADSRRSFVAAAPDVDGVGTVMILKGGASSHATQEVPGDEPSVIRWCDATGGLREQEFAVENRSREGFGCFDCTPVDARQQVGDVFRELAVVYDTASFGSGSPRLRLALFQLQDDAWVQIWDSATEEEWRGSHGRIEFPAGDLSEFVVHADSWGDWSDGFGGVIAESNAGPHRFFVDTWVREGDEYTRRSMETIPAPYATLVEFMYALRTNDDAQASALVTERALVERGIEAGLGGAPGPRWSVTCAEAGGRKCGKAEPIRFFTGPAVAITFVEEGGRWLISAIEPSENAR